MILQQVTLTSAGGSFDPYVDIQGIATYKSYLIQGTATLASNVGFTPSVDSLGGYFEILWEADITVSTFSVFVAGTTLNQADLNQSGKITAYYDGSAWIVQYFPNNLEQPQEFYSVDSVAVPSGGGTLTLVAGVDAFYQRISSLAVSLSSNYTVTASTTGIKDGTRFFVDIIGNITLGSSTLTVFGISIPASQALNGGTQVQATFDAKIGVWRAIQVNQPFQLSNIQAISALSVVANATNASASPTALAASTNGDLFMRSGTSLIAGAIRHQNFAISTENFSPRYLAVTVPSANVLTSGVTPVALVPTSSGNPVLLTILFGLSSSGTVYATNTDIAIRYVGGPDIATLTGALALSGNDYYEQQILVAPTVTGGSTWGNGIEFYTLGGNPTAGTKTIFFYVIYTTVPSP